MESIIVYNRICDLINVSKAFMKPKQKIKSLNYTLLRKKIPLSTFDFETTDELEALNKFLGQERALQAVKFGIGVNSQGYNMYAMGPSGIGKRSLIRSVLKEHAATRAIPSDWCYIHNFKLPSKPIALELPPGIGPSLQDDMKMLVEELSNSILAVFESDEYNNSMAKINQEFNRKRRQKDTKNINTKLIPRLYKERHKKEKSLQCDLTRIVVEPIINKVKKKYPDLKNVTDYLSSVQEDVISHVNDFIKMDEVTNTLYFDMESPLLINYQVNLLVNNKDLAGAPIIFEDNPSYSNLICRIEHSALNGVLTTNFTLIKPGSLHRANGGYLVIEARKLKKYHDAWDGLKRALYTREIKIDSPEDLSDQAKPISLEPESIPLNVKIILLGERYIYFTLTNHDPDFNELFKVTIDFDEAIDRNKKNIELYARLIATIVQKEKLRTFHRDAVSAIIEHSSRIAEDNEKLSMHIRSLNNLVIEADYWAGIKGNQMVRIGDVQEALTSQIHRMDRTRELYYEDIYRNFIIIHTEGSVVGQVNALSVVRSGKFSYGHPTRITAVVRVGKGQIIDIQREIKMAGPSFSKAGFIISNFIASRYSHDHPLSLFASFSFEQMYAHIDGDSASVAEVCALLSALANVPIKQSIAVTGSMDQYGRVQAIGGVNEKIEGYFDICKFKGLDGSQSVIIPAVNIKNLMLREDIVDAVRKKLFYIYVIDYIDDAIKLLTGMTAGPKINGKYNKNTFNYKVEKKLLEFSERGKSERLKLKKNQMD